MAGLRVCFSLFVEEGQRQAIALELAKRYEASGKTRVQSKDERLYGVIENGVLYVRRLFPTQDESNKVA